MQLEANANYWLSFSPAAMLFVHFPQAWKEAGAQAISFDLWGQNLAAASCDLKVIMQTSPRKKKTSLQCVQPSVEKDTLCKVTQEAAQPCQLPIGPEEKLLNLRMERTGDCLPDEAQLLLDNLRLHPSR